jgi:hypothetical protein
MAGELLLDTGALVSVLDRSQVHHGRCVRFFSEWDAPVLSTEAVLTEATHLLGRVRNVFTTDRRDFRVYRIRGRKSFKILPE